MRVSESEFSVPPVIGARDMANPEVDHIGVMAYAAWHRSADHAPPMVVPQTIVPVAAPPPASVPPDCYANIETVLRVNTERYLNVRQKHI